MPFVFGSSFCRLKIVTCNQEFRLVIDSIESVPVKVAVFAICQGFTTLSVFLVNLPIERDVCILIMLMNMLFACPKQVGCQTPLITKTVVVVFVVNKPMVPFTIEDAQFTREVLCFCFEVDTKVSRVGKVCIVSTLDKCLGNRTVKPSVMLFIIDPRSVCLTEFNTGIRQYIVKIEVSIFQTYFPVTIGFLCRIECHTRITFGVVKQIRFKLNIVSSGLKIIIGIIVGGCTAFSMFAMHKPKIVCSAELQL